MPTSSGPAPIGTATQSGTPSCSTISYATVRVASTTYGQVKVVVALSQPSDALTAAASAHASL